jgi:tetratricopeptide (TPR) repeat protein
LCGAYRSEEADPVRGIGHLIGSLQREDLLEEIHLNPLSSRGVSAMLRQLVPGREISQGFDEFIYQNTDGNPYFVEEYLRYLNEENLIRGVRKKDQISISVKAGSELKVPQSIHSLIQRRIEPLSQGMKETLSCAALLGKEFEFDVLQRVLERPQMEILEAMEEGIRSNVVRESLMGRDRYRFAHALMADALYSSLGKLRRRLWHGRAGDVLEEFYGSRRVSQYAPTLVHHFEKGGNWDKALDYALKGAMKARKDYAYEEAIRLYEKAREIYPRVPNTASSTSKSEGRGNTKTAIAEGLGDLYQIAGDFHKTLKGNQEVTGEALEYYEESLRIRREINDKGGEASILNSIGRLHWNHGDYGKALADLEASLALRREIGDRWGTALGLMELGTQRRLLHDHRMALEYHMESLTLMEEMGARIETVRILTETGWDYHYSGDDEKALHYLNESLRKVKEWGLKRVEPEVLIALSEVCLSRGLLEDAQNHCDRMLEMKERIGLKENLARGKRMKGEILLTVAVARIGQASSSSRKDRSPNRAGSSSKKENQEAESSSSGGVATNVDDPVRVAKTLEEAEKELKEALEIAREMGSMHLMWEIHASLGKLYKNINALPAGRRGFSDFGTKAEEELSKAKEIIQEIASTIIDEEMKNNFLNEVRVRKIFSWDEATPQNVDT